YWLWHPPWRRRRRSTVPNVPAGGPWGKLAEIPQLGSRPFVSIPSVAGQSSNSRNIRNQDGSFRSAVASVRGAPDRHGSPRVPRSDPVLDNRRSGDKADRIPRLL